MLCEYKGIRLTSRQRAGVQMRETIDAIEKAVGSKGTGVGQLARSISRICSGEVVISGNTKVDLTTCKQIIPILVLYEESTGNHAARNYLQQRFEEFLNVAPPDAERIAPLLLLTTQDMEAFEELTNLLRAESIITDYAAIVRRFPRAPESMFRAYASIKFAGRERRRGLVMNKLDSLLTEVHAEYVRREEFARRNIS